jgi:hypothetical protein
MDTLGATLSITPDGTAISTALDEVDANTINSSTRVMAVNGDDKKKVVFINDASDNMIASFTLPRYNSITFIKKSTDKVYGQNYAPGKGSATNLTFQQVISRHAD